MPKKLKLISASSLDTYQACQRKWGWRKIDKIQVQSNTAATNLGSKTHKVLEDYLNGVSVPVEDPKDPYTPESIAARAIAAGHLPKPGVGEVEYHFKDEENGWTGFKDVLVGPWKRTPEDLARFGGKKRGELIPLIIDHKTSSNPGMYHKTSEILQHSDSQSNLYAQEAFRKYPKAKKVDLFWSYMGTKQKIYLPIFARMTREENEKTMERLSKIAQEMRDHLENTVTAADLEANMDQCSAYGGCPYMEHCWGVQDPLDVMLSMFPEKLDMSQFEEEEKKQEMIKLYIGCRPTKGPEANEVKFIHEYLQPLEAEVAKVNKVSHYKLMPYNAGPGAVADAVVKNPPPAGVYFVPHYTVEAPILEALVQTADEVVS